MKNRIQQVISEFFLFGTSLTRLKKQFCLHPNGPTVRQMRKDCCHDCHVNSSSPPVFDRRTSCRTSYMSNIYIGTNSPNIMSLRFSNGPTSSDFSKVAKTSPPILQLWPPLCWIFVWVIYKGPSHTSCPPMPYRKKITARIRNPNPTTTSGC